MLFQTWVCHASTHNSVLDGVTDEITGPLLALGDVTLERLNLSCQVRLINRAVSSTAIATLLCIGYRRHVRTPRATCATLLHQLLQESSEQSPELAEHHHQHVIQLYAQGLQVDRHVTVDHRIRSLPCRQLEHISHS